MKRISKFLSLLMVAAMLSMLIPVSAFAAGETVSEKEPTNELGLVLVTTEAVDTETVVTEETEAVPKLPRCQRSQQLLPTIVWKSRSFRSNR
jgi:hypothetical protein